MSLTPALLKEQQVDLCQFKASLVYTVRQPGLCRETISQKIKWNNPVVVEYISFLKYSPNFSIKTFSNSKTTMEESGNGVKYRECFPLSLTQIWARFSVIPGWPWSCSSPNSISTAEIKTWHQLGGGGTRL